MDKAILKKFAIESRKDLMQKINNKIKTFYIDEEFSKEQKGELYILSNEKHSLSLTNDEFLMREVLIKRIEQMSLEQVVEEASYTWFNRIIAIRYMEIKDYLPLTKDNQSLGIRVLSSKDNTSDPEILKFTHLINPDLDIRFKKEKYAQLKNDHEKFAYILHLVCKKIGRVIPQVFGGVTDYIDILMPDNLLNDTGFITKLIREIPEENYNQVEIIGWLYQYYNQTEKDRVISAKKVYKKNEIAYATQLFTPDWIVKYMVENSLGKYWIEHNKGEEITLRNNQYSSIMDQWRYLIRENIEIKNEKLDPTEITFIDPCCGSGHILVYAFEIFFQLYLQAGYNKQDISQLILKNNLYGLDIDDRAGQLSVLSILLKAREYDRHIFNKEIIRNLNIMSIPESNAFPLGILDYINLLVQKQKAHYLIDSFQNAKEIGSLLILDHMDYTDLEKAIYENTTIFGTELREKLLPMIRVSNILQRQYDIVVTNPPYMSCSSMLPALKSYLSKNYENSKKDLCTAFMEVNLVRENGYYAMINQHSWMFLNSYTNLRGSMIENMNICSMVHLGTRAFEEINGEVVQTTSFVMKKSKINDLGIYIRLVDIENAALKEKAFLEVLEKKGIFYLHRMKDFNKIPSGIIAYWLSKKVFEVFQRGTPLGQLGHLTNGMFTCDNRIFLRKWYEVSNESIFYDCHNKKESLKSDLKWYPYNKGGDFRKWYGNHSYVINFAKFGSEVSKFRKSKGQSASFPGKDRYFHRSISWSLVSSYKFGARFYPEGFVFDIAGSSYFPRQHFKYILGFLTSNVATTLLNILNPTMNFQIGDVSKVPLIYDEKYEKRVETLVDQCIALSKNDWDEWETSWHFKTIRLLDHRDELLENSIEEEIKRKKNEAFLEQKYETELNDIFMEIYSLREEESIKMYALDKDLSIRLLTPSQLVKNLISYAVGCMFGRYSLDEEGLIYAGGDFHIERYKTFNVDLDNIIPITDAAYFEDDIVEKFKQFIGVVYGYEKLTNNLDFIAQTLGKKGTETSQETIRRYFVNDFFYDHVKRYQKRPIYWLLDSGKKNGFKALIYLHRYNENLIPKVRLDYLHTIQTVYEKLLSDVNYKLTSLLSLPDKKESQNRQAQLNAKLQEIKEYDEKIAHIANQRIHLDLDDGVVDNYSKFSDILAKIK